MAGEVRKLISVPFQILYFLLHLNLLWFPTVIGPSSIISVTNRRDFPPSFVFGAGSSAYQIEGAVAEDGRKPNIWDSFIHARKIDEENTADIAADQYHKYKEDVKLMHEMGLDAYRLSFSWSRILPDVHGDVNPKGLNHYNNLIDELVSYGIEPHVTLSHFDLPQALQDEYKGHLSPKIIGNFTAYADICIKQFGDRVKYWTTFNEPNIQSVLGNDVGTIPPARCSYPFGAVNCSEGDSTTEPYISAHNILLSHSAAANLYKEKYQEKQRGRIGITFLAHWLEPMTDSPQDVAATKRLLDFQLSWFLDSLVYGKYPVTMRKIVESQLPVFTENESKQLKNSYDFIGLNHYCVLYVQDVSITPDEYGSDYIRDAAAKWSSGKGLPAKDLIMSLKLKAPGGVVPIAAWGLRRLLEHIKLKYKNPPVMIHENGYSTKGDDSSNPTARNDR